MYAIQIRQEGAARWHLRDTPLWRFRWALLAAAAAALLGAGYAREASGSPAAARAATADTVTVAPGDTLWDIASSRYPGADPRQKVFEIEQLNGLGGPAIEAGQRLRLPAR